MSRLPANTTLVGAIKRFHSLDGRSGIKEGRIELENGTVCPFSQRHDECLLMFFGQTITGIDRIIFATGFRYTFPFLPQYHNSSLGLNETATGGALQPLVTDGSHVRSLHLDLFYIEEPTLGFINRASFLVAVVFSVSR